MDKFNKYYEDLDSIMEVFFANLPNKKINENLDVDDFSEYADLGEDDELTEAIRYGLSQLTEEISEDDFNSLQPGDIILVRVYQNAPELGNIKHPVRPLIITSIKGDTVYGFTLTTVVPPERYEFKYLSIGDDYLECGLDKSSYIELEVRKYNKRQYIYPNKTGAVRAVILGHINNSLKNKLMFRMQQIKSMQTWILDQLDYYPNQVLRDLADI